MRARGSLVGCWRVSAILVSGAEAENLKWRSDDSMLVCDYNIVNNQMQGGGDCCCARNDILNREQVSLQAL